ncbi:MAG TPA: macro domain-containing protein [Clostridiales bacterium]|jgi:O-acetyl-ADP-ribose deacetylase (regulator of RNase III)/transcriptional regulator with XRE-family HTH domain|nr:macro domain-containing protein [Bacillota bacterium]HOA55584.1 macro domain-containing protein [Clostridiales bacterium]HOL92319.1 macro domain-containing protein [Clostridiales bacterium]HPP36441.1 macro domain-containing protein [Clostridiales bacterium]HQD32253.1 macro domain-containing protein [Clostridiales bacterium]
MPFTIVRQDITKMKVDAIVNAANTELQMGGGVCGAIFKAAGAARLQAACDKLAPIRTGEAVITPGFDLPAKFVIHTAGPVYRKQNAEQSEKLLRSAYMESLRLAIENKCESIAFPLISSGIYGYPKDEALKVAVSAIQDFLIDHDIDVTLAVFDKSSFIISRELLGAVESYIDEHYVDKHEIKRRKLLDAERLAIFEADEDAVKYNKPLLKNMLAPVGAPAPLDDLVGNLDEPFSQMLLRLIDAKGMTDVEVYKRANLDRKLFSKIRSNKGYMPSKRTAVALAVALKLSLDETDAFLRRAGYALSHAVKFDVIVEYFIANGKYDIFEINEVLFEYDQPLLGGG